MNNIEIAKRCLMEGYSSLPVSIKLNLRLDDIVIIEQWMSLFEKYMSNRRDEDEDVIRRRAGKEDYKCYSYYEEYLNNEYKYVIDGFFKTYQKTLLQPQYF